MKMSPDVINYKSKKNMKSFHCHRIEDVRHPPAWRPLLYGLMVIGLSVPSESALKRMLLRVSQSIWRLVLLFLFVDNTYEVLTMLERKRVILLVDTLFLILLVYFMDRNLWKLVKYFERMESRAHSWENSFKPWSWISCFFVIAYNVASFTNVLIFIMNKGYNCPALTDLLFLIRGWPLAIKVVNILFQIAIISRTFLANYAPTMIALVCCFTLKMERKVLQHQNSRIAQRLGKGLSDDSFAEAARMIHETSSLLQSVTQSMSLVILILISYWISNIFVCITNILQRNTFGLQIQVFLTCVVLIFSSMFAYLAHLASNVRHEYLSLKDQLLSVAESDSRLFEKTSVAANLELLGRIHEGMAVKTLVTPLEMFTVDSKLILTVLGTVITYSVLIF
ncbi:uncharacterized protein TNIN_239151 [Trichonephila inaurata madagascariensis]|uniref:Uncharacterized protein n=1 Tax=Trichonephila inaurata madagascariensis TaxID=2747483 RepID=A0A8X6Y2X2_9ARAC|nr:uncharacterized protein TNIN_239151 [Trichonephila inaurata madagascariensis]